MTVTLSTMDGREELIGDGFELAGLFSATPLAAALFSSATMTAAGGGGDAEAKGIQSCGDGARVGALWAMGGGVVADEVEWRREEDERGEDVWCVMMWSWMDMSCGNSGGPSGLDAQTASYLSGQVQRCTYETAQRSGAVSACTRSVLLKFEACNAVRQCWRRYPRVH